MRRMLSILLPFLILFLLCSCTDKEDAPPLVQVVLEQGEGYTAETYVQTVPAGEDAVFHLDLQPGWAVTGTDRASALYDSGTLTLPEVRYSTVVRPTVQKGVSILCHANGGTRLDGGNPEEPIEIPTPQTHLRLNTPMGTDLFARDGYTLIGWNTRPDGSGESVGLGSRIAWEDGLTLYAQWAKWTPETAFTWEPDGAGVRITGYTGSDEVLVIPATLGGIPVWSIGKEACAGANCTGLVLPPALKQVAENAFANTPIQEVWLSDSIESITDYAFTGCTDLQTLHINAAEAPVYSSSYYAAFADKFDRLLSLQGQPKLVLFSGSSARFGYDCSLLAEAFPDYAPVNMGVFAYTSATPQFLLLLNVLEEGDILVHSPEFDAAQRQFCTRSDLEDNFFCMMEANYDVVSRLDLRQCSSVFTGLTQYLAGKVGMEPLDWSISPASYTEEGVPSSTPTYNEYGDYCLYRPNAADESPVYGLPVDYTVRSFPQQQFLDPLNAMYRCFLDKGVHVYFTYAPRNRLALSEDSTPEARSDLDQYFRDHLCVPVLSDIESSLWSGIYLSGTDNHLSTQGADIRTRQFIDELRARMAQDGIPHSIP